MWKVIFRSEAKLEGHFHQRSRTMVDGRLSRFKTFSAWKWTAQKIKNWELTVQKCSRNNKVGGKNRNVQVDGLEFIFYTHPSFNCINLHSYCNFTDRLLSYQRPSSLCTWSLRCMAKLLLRNFTYESYGMTFFISSQFFNFYWLFQLQ